MVVNKVYASIYLGQCPYDVEGEAESAKHSPMSVLDQICAYRRTPGGHRMQVDLHPFLRKRLAQP